MQTRKNVAHYYLPRDFYALQSVTLKAGRSLFPVRVTSAAEPARAWSGDIPPRPEWAAVILVEGEYMLKLWPCPQRQYKLIVRYVPCSKEC